MILTLMFTVLKFVPLVKPIESYIHNRQSNRVNNISVYLSSCLHTIVVESAVLVRFYSIKDRGWSHVTYKEKNNAQYDKRESMKEMWYEVRCLKSNEDMILALAGQFKQLSHEPEKLRWLNGIRTHDLCDAMNWRG